MSKKCKAFSISKLGLEPPDNRKAFYAGWDAALENMEKEWVGLTDEEIDYIWGGSQNLITKTCLTYPKL